MSTSPDLLPVAARPLPLVRRSDIEAESLELHGQRWWRIKDPVTMRFWQLGEEEYFLWSLLRIGASLQELQRRFAERFAPRRIELRALEQYLAALHREGLIASTAAGQGETLLARHEQQRIRSRRSWLNLLAIRFPGVDPTGVLNFLYPRVAWMFHPAALAAFGLLIASALGLFLVHAEEFHRRSPNASQFLAPSNLMLVALAMAGAKICHELGHALVCRHLGGRCHELGVMLLVFTPCLYCNVSDAWLMPSRWRRLAVSGAGIGVELLLASMATWLWWTSEPGRFSELCWNLMIVCSINTVLFNGNPLLRYDGYFLLSDLLDVPNLRAAGDEWLRQSLRRLLAGGEPGERPPALRDRPLFVPVYAVASLVYRWVLTFFIWWFVMNWFRERGMAAIGVSLVGLSAVVVVGSSLRGGWVEFRNAYRSRRASAGRAAISVLVVLVLLAAGLTMPFPWSIRAPATLRPADADIVYVRRPGRLVRAIEPGRHVRKDDEIAWLENEELQEEIVRLTGDVELLEQQLMTLRRRQVQQATRGAESPGAQIPSLEKQLAAVQSQLDKRKEDHEQLTLRAPRDGVVMPLRNQNESRSTSQELPAWSGSPLDQKNLGSYLEAGVAVCQVGATNEREAVVVVDQSQVDAVSVGQRVYVRLDEHPSNRIVGRVERIAALRSESAPAEMVAKQMVPVSRDPNSTELPGAYYQVFVRLPPGDDVPFGASGHARIGSDPMPLYRRLWRNWVR